MAEIKMDVSEYETMKENKRLLEDSLKREKELGSQIKSLNEEKIKILEDAKMKVIRVEKIDVTETILVQSDHFNILCRLRELSKRTDGFNPSTSYMYRGTGYEIESIIECFFTKQKSVSLPTIKSTTTHGLDEVKGELREEIKAEMGKEILEKLRKAEEIIDKHSEEEEKLSKAESKVKFLQERCMDVEKFLHEKTEILDHIYKELPGVIHKTSFFGKLFGYSKVARKVRKILQDANTIGQAVRESPKRKTL